MFSTLTVGIPKSVVSGILTHDSISYNVSEIYKNKLYYNGVVTDAEILNNNYFIYPLCNKGRNYKVNILVKYTIFSIPPGFILPNCKVIEIQNNNDQMIIRMACDLDDINGKELSISHVLYPIITSDGKSADQNKKYLSLKVNDMINVRCITPLIYPNHEKFVAVFDIMSKITPIAFIANNMIADNIASFEFIDVDKQLLQLLFIMPSSVKIVKSLDVGKQYSMSPIGFYESNNDDSVDFILETNESVANRIVDINDLYNYLKAILYNWKLLLINNEKLYKSGKLNALSFKLYE